MEKLAGTPLCVKIKYVRCGQHRKPNIRKTLGALGLTRINQVVIHKNILPIRGMIHTVKHYIEVEPILFDPARVRE